MTPGTVTGSDARLITPRLIRSLILHDYRHHRKLAVVGELTDDEAQPDGARRPADAVRSSLHCPKEQSTNRPMPRWIIDDAKDCDQSIFREPAELTGASTGTPLGMG